jgi:hypothetical protein
MVFEHLSFGAIKIDGVEYEHDVVIDRGRVRKRKKGPSKKLRGEFGHTPLSIEEDIPWHGDQLVIGTGLHGALPIAPEVRREAERQGVKLQILPTQDAIALLNTQPSRTNAVLHVTC